MNQPLSPRALLAWYLEAGVDECVGDAPLDRYAAAAPPAPPPQPSGGPPVGAGAGPSLPGLAEPAAAPPAPVGPAAAPSADGAVQTAYALASTATSVAELRQALETFEGCALKKTATNLVFYDGNPEARLIFIGEAPGAEEDRQGLPFVGPSGQLLDRMLDSIGLDRRRFLITNTVFWRPPGNRNPTTMEMAICLPFVERLVELVDPEILITLGGAAAKAMLAQTESVGRLRGRWFTFSTPRLSRPVQAAVTYHPAYLLRSPAQKRQSWRDLLEIKRKLDSL